MALTVLRIYEWYNESGYDENEPNGGNIVLDGETLLGIFDDVCEYGNGGFLFKQFLPPHVDHAQMTYVNPEDGDEFDIIPPDEWTDEMCQRVALLALGVLDDE